MASFNEQPPSSSKMTPIPPPTTTNNKLQSLIYTKDEHGKPSLQVLDQLLLPDETKYINVTNFQTTYNVIHDMNIRGAPLIAIVAVLGLTVDLVSNDNSCKELDQIEEMNGIVHSGKAILTYIQGKMDYLSKSRPTAVNLFNALKELQEQLIDSLQTDTTTNTSTATATTTTTTSPREKLLSTLQKYAEFMLERDIQDNRLIGQYGAKQILDTIQKKNEKENSSSNSSSTGNAEKSTPRKVRIMTICNTGSLATASYGTALGVVRALIEMNQLDTIIALETRPYNQGARLTSYEMIVEGMPNATLICDSMAAAAMKHYSIDAVVVGADRVCANGDTANKIGTYNLSLVAAAHNIPFYVAAPFTTLDISLRTGESIPIEVRPAIEFVSTARAPTNMNVWNPAFDITPAKYITGGIITEKGIISPTGNGILDVHAFVQEWNDTRSNVPKSSHEETNNAATTTTAATPIVTNAKLYVPDGYVEQNVSSLPTFIAENVPTAMKVLNATCADDLDCCEMGDGNLNLVFIVSNKNEKLMTTTTTTNTDNASSTIHNPFKKIIVKQALPYVRCVGESWPMTIDRSYYEYRALQIEKAACPEHVPDLYYFSRPHALIVMEYLAPPIQILRKGLIQGIQYNTMASDMGTFCAKTLFQTSGYTLSTTSLREQVEFWSTNREMCSLTETVVFTEPYIKNHPNNHWTKPQLDHDKECIENDVPLKIAANILKQKFVTQTQALIHADLHTGSVMCSPTNHSTYVIDPEFAFYGPMAFDIGAFLANLFLSYVSQSGYELSSTSSSSSSSSNGTTTSSIVDRNKYGEWILEQIQIFWDTFVHEFTMQWKDSKAHTGFVFGRDLLGTVLDGDACIEEYDVQLQKLFFQGLLYDSIGFAGMKMIRRIVGIAHVEDLECISDPTIRSVCERRGLNIAKQFVKDSTKFDTIEQAIALARDTK